MAAEPQIRMAATSSGTDAAGVKELASAINPLSTKAVKSNAAPAAGRTGRFATQATEARSRANF